MNRKEATRNYTRKRTLAPETFNPFPSSMLDLQMNGHMLSFLGIYFPLTLLRKSINKPNSLLALFCEKLLNLWFQLIVGSFGWLIALSRIALLIYEKNVEIPTNISRSIIVGEFLFQERIHFACVGTIDVSLGKKVKLFIGAIKVVSKFKNFAVRSLSRTIHYVCVYVSMRFNPAYSHTMNQNSPVPGRQTDCTEKRRP